MSEAAAQFSRIQRRIVTVLFTASSLFSASVIASFTLTSIIAADMTGSESMAGMPNAIGVLGRAGFALPFGYLMDRIGRRRSLSFGFGLAVAGSLISVWAISGASFALFVLGALLLGMSRAAGDQTRYVGAEVFRSSSRAEAIGIIVSAGAVGAILGPLLVPISTSWMQNRGLTDMAGPFVVSAILTFASLLIVSIWLRPDPQRIGEKVAAQEAAENPHNVENIAGEGRTLREIFASPMTQLAVLAMILSFFVMAMVMIITPLHMDRHNHSTAAISGIISAHTLGMYGLAWFTGRLINRFGRVQMIVAGTAVLALSCILAPLSLRLPILGLALFLLGLGWNFCYVAGSTLFADGLAHQERGLAQGASETLVALGNGVASVASGLIFAQGQFMLVSAVGLLATLALLAATFVLVRRDRMQAAVSAAD